MRYINENDEVKEYSNYTCLYCGTNFIQEKHDFVCPECNNHYRIPVKYRIKQLFDLNSFKEKNKQMITNDPLHFSKYKEQMEALQDVGKYESVITGEAKIKGIAIGVCIFDGSFKMGTLGKVAGMKIHLQVEECIKEKIPVLFITISGGARMQEGIYSLFQMRTTISDVDKMHSEKLPVLTLLANPTTGGVSASFVQQSDFIVAEPNATVGFAGKRVINGIFPDTVFPNNFQKSEHLFSRGQIDKIVSRNEQRNLFYRFLKFWHLEVIGSSKKNFNQQTFFSGSQKENKEVTNIYNDIRGFTRLMPEQYSRTLCKDTIELSGDRLFEDDASVSCYFANFDNQKCICISNNKGTTLKERANSNFGMIRPSGYRKIIRVVEIANRLSLPIVVFFDTMGADPTVMSEEQNQSSAISDCILSFITAEVPIISVCTGEGGSGGALALSCGDKLFMLENSVFSVASPEAISIIAWKDTQHNETAMSESKIRATDHVSIGFADKKISEPLDKNGCQDAHKLMVLVKDAICSGFYDLNRMTSESRIQNKKNKII